jgi:YbbR domain-containing protein
LEKIPKDPSNPYIRRKEYKAKQKIFTFLFFLVLATIFWLLNALDHNYSTNTVYPLRYIHQLPDKEMVGEIPSEITLNIGGRGYSLLWNKLTVAQHPLTLRVMSLSFYDIPSDSNHYFILTKNLKETLQRQLGSELVLNYISPDTIFYNFSTIIRKKVPVEPNVDIEFEKQFMLGSSIISQPDSIIISGPHSLIDTINKVQTLYKKFEKVDKSFSIELKLKPIDGAYFVRKKVTLTFPVDKFTESSVFVPIKVINQPDSMRMKTFPSGVRVSFIVSLENFNKATTQQFRVIVDYNGIYSSINNKLKVILERQPAYIRSVSYRPRYVDYIIEK